MMQAVTFQLPPLEPFRGDSDQLPLFLTQFKLRIAIDAMLEDVPEEKVFMAIGYLRGPAFACIERY
jgi:hypothetical protein